MGCVFLEKGGWFWGSGRESVRDEEATREKV